MQAPVGTPAYIPGQAGQQPNVIIAGSPVVSPSQVFPERYGLPPLGVIPGGYYPPPPPYMYRPYGYRPYGPYGYPYPYYY